LHGSFDLFRQTLKKPTDHCEDPARVFAPPATSLSGYNVTLNADFPDLGTHRTIPNTQAVSPRVEFLTGSLQLTSAIPLISSRVDIGPAYVDVNYVVTATSASGAFNGLVLDFDSMSPKIIDAKLDPISTFTSAQVTVGFSDHRVTINAPALFIPAGARILVQLTLLPWSPSGN
jgi:hypothetical protein